jgi:ribosomal protein L37AE/L43A
MLIQSELKIEEKETATPTCPSCGDVRAISRSLTGQTVYLQCGSCQHTWSIAERRRATRAEDYRKRF